MIKIQTLGHLALPKGTGGPGVELSGRGDGSGSCVMSYHPFARHFPPASHAFELPIVPPDRHGRAQPDGLCANLSRAAAARTAPSIT